MTPRRGFFQSIRFKLLLVSLSLLAIPWAGYRYIQETERFLRQTQETMLLGTAQAVAAILHNSPAIINSTRDGETADAGTPLQYVNRLEQPIQLDGYTEDWLPYLGNLQRYPAEGEWLFESILGEDAGHLYLLLRVNDQQVLHHPPGSVRLDQGDYVDITLGAADGGVSRYRMASTAPGWVTARRLPAPAGSSAEPIGREDRIQGEWQTSERGYTLEMRIPRYLLGERIAITVADLDDPAQPLARRLVSSTGDGQPTRLGRLVRPDPEIGRLIGGLEHENARIWVVNNQRLVLARRGRLQPPEAVTEADEPVRFSPLQPLMRLILDQPSEHFQDDFTRSARLQGREIDAALTGQPQSRRRNTPDGRAVILSAAWPIQSSAGVAGAVLVEQTTNRILSLQNQALEQITGTTLLLFLFVGLAILGFASLLTTRIRRLNQRIETAVTSDGRIQGTLSADQSADEIGDLSRSFSGVLNRLAEYNRYLEAMASRLAHEFRTPLTIVRSSLENLQSDPAEGDRERYLLRAQEGIERLGLILHRMREATRLEQQLLQTELAPFDLGALLEMALEGYRSAFPDVTFELDRCNAPVIIRGAPDLISQALDKLISNAVDFHQPGSAIRLILKKTERRLVRLSVRNIGPPLPEGMERELFASMVSIRKTGASEPHMGLGLYLVRLISEFHGGHAEARTLDAHSAVEFSLLLPSSPTDS
ncbi:proteobacterial dedicated sortase system histidine kinase [Sedimenticola hydrogenitrophicus]|uniref:proteobacterial dedicated sortase system histidine kinase n=1 Tax=Sedimenticola hydrogenitrophicus TaxID=2967975 RepID=UPI0021A9253A|nr:proteobacterial dedicated sortase system histidine kinase [Sedimenticola hydrogenitrophicus]